MLTEATPAETSYPVGSFFYPGDGPGWQLFLAWKNAGNTPDPWFSPAELTALSRQTEVNALKIDLTQALVWQFRMILTLWQLGVSKGLWTAADVADATLKQKVNDWKTKVDRLKVIDE
jgi:hypothetical protein